MSKTRLTQQRSDDVSADTPSEERVPRLIRKKSELPNGRFRALRWLLIGVAGLGLLFVMAPTLIGKTALGDWLLKQLVPTALGTVEIGQRDLGWWSPVSLGQVQVKDADGKLLLQVGSLRTKETLWEILTTRQVSELDIHQAAARLDWRADSSNWEDWIARLTKDTAPTPKDSSPTPDLVIRFQDCQVLLESASDQQRWIAEQLAGDVSIQRNGQQILIQASAQLKDADQNLDAGRCEATLLITDQTGLGQARQEWHLAVDDPQSFQVNTTTGGVAFMVQMDRLAASLGRSILRRYIPTLELSGLASGQVAGLSNWYGDYVQVTTPKVVVDRLRVGDRDYLSGDRLQLQLVETAGTVTMSPGALHLKQVRLNSDFGRSDMDGSLEYEQLYNALSTRRLPTTTLQSTGTINVALLANQLPRTLQLQDDLQLDQGELVWQVFNRPEGDGSQRLFVDVTAKNIAGSRSGNRVQWGQPIQVSASVRDYNRPVTFDHLDLRSDFVQADVRPQTDGGTQINFEVNFDRLRGALDQFFQLPPLVMQGHAGGQATWKMLAGDGRPATIHEPAAGMEVRSVIALKGAHLAFPNYFEIREPNMRLDASTTMQWGNPGTESLGMWALLQPDADVTIQAGRIELVTLRPDAPAGAATVAIPNSPNQPQSLGLLVNLQQPVHLPRLNQVFQYLAGTKQPPANPANVPVLQAEVNVSGPLDEWLAMIRPLLVGVDIALTGSCQTKFNVTLNERFALIHALQGSSQQFGFRGYGVILQEPVVRLEGAASYHYANGLIHSEDFHLVGSSLAASAKKTRLLLSPVGNRMEGEIYFRGDVARLWHTYQVMQVAAAEGEPNKLGARALDWESLPKPLAPPNVDEAQQIQLVSLSEPSPAEAAGSGPLGTIAGQPAVTGGASAGTLAMGGDLSGMLKLSTEENQSIKMELETEIKEAWVASQQTNGQWAYWMNKEQIIVKTTADVAADFNRIDIPALPDDDPLVIVVIDPSSETQRLKGVAAGRLLELNRQPQMDFRGTIDSSAVDWLRQFAGNDIGDLEINGLHRHNFEVVGPMALQEMQGRWISSWQQIKWMGLQSGPADIVLQLQQGIVKMVPLRFAAGGGNVHLAPEVDLRHEPIWVRLPRGVIFDQVKLTPQICRNWLKYSAPLLAEVTSVQGTFSLDSDGIEVPLSDWTRMVAKARVTINGARVGPGPLGIQIGNIASTVRAMADGQSINASALEMIGLGRVASLARSGDGQRTQAIGEILNAIGTGQRPELPTPGLGNPQPGTTSDGAAGINESNVTWLEIPVQTIAVNYQDGAVVHDRISMTVRGFELVTKGRVGLDQSVDVDAQLLVPADVLEKNPQLASAFGSSVRLPITGTLTAPSIQSGALRTAMHSAVNQGLQQKLGEFLPGQNNAGETPANPLPDILQQGQRQLEEQLNEKLKLPPANEAQDAVNRLLNRGLERGRQRLFGGDQ